MPERSRSCPRIRRIALLTPATRAYVRSTSTRARDSFKQISSDTCRPKRCFVSVQLLTRHRHISRTPATVNDARRAQNREEKQLNQSTPVSQNRDARGDRREIRTAFLGELCDLHGKL